MNTANPLTSELPARRTSGLAVASLVFSLLWLFGIGSLIAVVCGHMALADIKRKPAYVGGNGLAVAGLILGYVFGLPTILSAVAFLVINWGTF